MFFAACPARPQGQLVFENRVNNVVVAPVYGLDPARPALVKRGNTSGGFPSGAQSYTAPPLAGPGFTAQLFGGPPHAAIQNLQPISPAVRFRIGPSAGFVVAPSTTVSVPGVAEGALAKIQLRAWDNGNGTTTNWAQVESAPIIPHGESWPILTAPLGGPFRAPPNLTGLESFNLVTGSTAGLGLAIRINFQPGTVPAPPGYVVDTGLVYGPHDLGLTYGWNSDHSNEARDRDAAVSSDQRHDTFIEMRAGSTWELELGNGLYGIHVAAGDPLVTNGVQGVLLEGATLRAPITPAQRWLEADALVEVSDGRLTLRGIAETATNRICFLQIVGLNPVQLEAPSRWSGAGGFPLLFSGEVGFQYRIESSPDFTTWQPAGLAAPLSAERFQFLDVTAPAVPARGYRAVTLTVP